MRNRNNRSVTNYVDPHPDLTARGGRLGPPGEGGGGGNAADTRARSRFADKPRRGKGGQGGRGGGGNKPRPAPRVESAHGPGIPFGGGGPSNGKHLGGPPARPPGQRPPDNQAVDNFGSAANFAERPTYDQFVETHGGRSNPYLAAQWTQRFGGGISTLSPQMQQALADVAARRKALGLQSGEVLRQYGA